MEFEFKGHSRRRRSGAVAVARKEVSIAKRLRKKDGSFNCFEISLSAALVKEMGWELGTVLVAGPDTEESDKFLFGITPGDGGYKLSALNKDNPTRFYLKLGYNFVELLPENTPTSATKVDYLIEDGVLVLDLSKIEGF